MRKLLVGLIGARIQRSLAPGLQEDEARHHGLRLHYQLIDLEKAEAGIETLPGLITAARIMGFAGLNITYPCKQSVIPLLNALSEEASEIGAVNTVVLDGGRLIGHNTDGPGWSWGFQCALPHADLSRVGLLGAGGAGSACANAVLRLGAKKLVIVDRAVERAVALAERMNSIHPGQRCCANADIVAALIGATGLIHATPIGMGADGELPLSTALLRSTLWVSDVVYVPLETELIKAAKRAGCRTMDGGHMNVGQAVGAFKLFTGLDADAERMDANFRRLAAA